MNRNKLMPLGLVGIVAFVLVGWWMHTHVLSGPRKATGGEHSAAGNSRAECYVAAHTVPLEEGDEEVLRFLGLSTGRSDVAKLSGEDERWWSKLVADKVESLRHAVYTEPIFDSGRGLALFLDGGRLKDLMYNGKAYGGGRQQWYVTIELEDGRIYERRELEGWICREPRNVSEYPNVFDFWTVRTR